MILDTHAKIFALQKVVRDRIEELTVELEILRSVIESDLLYLQPEPIAETLPETQSRPTKPIKRHYKRRKVKAVKVKAKAKRVVKVKRAKPIAKIKGKKWSRSQRANFAATMARKSGKQTINLSDRMAEPVGDRLTIADGENLHNLNPFGTEKEQSDR